MDEDELEMLSEARARLANTQVCLMVSVRFDQKQFFLLTLLTGQESEAKSTREAT